MIFDPQPRPAPQQRSAVLRTLSRWFGIRERIGRLDYAVCGISLAVLKYGVEAALIGRWRGTAFIPGTSSTR